MIRTYLLYHNMNESMYGNTLSSERVYCFTKKKDFEAISCFPIASISPTGNCKTFSLNRMVNGICQTVKTIVYQNIKSNKISLQQEMEFELFYFALLVHRIRQIVGKKLILSDIVVGIERSAFYEITFGEVFSKDFDIKDNNKEEYYCGTEIDAYSNEYSTLLVRYIVSTFSTGFLYSHPYTNSLLLTSYSDVSASSLDKLISVFDDFLAALKASDIKNYVSLDGAYENVKKEELTNWLGEPIEYIEHSRTHNLDIFLGCENQKELIDKFISNPKNKILWDDTVGAAAKLSNEDLTLFLQHRPVLSV